MIRTLLAPGEASAYVPSADERRTAKWSKKTLALNGAPVFPTSIRTVLPSTVVPSTGRQHAVDEPDTAVHVPKTSLFPPSQGKEEDAGGPIVTEQGTINVYPQHSKMTIYM